MGKRGARNRAVPDGKGKRDGKRTAVAGRANKSAASRRRGAAVARANKSTRTSTSTPPSPALPTGSTPAPTPTPVSSVTDTPALAPMHRRPGRAVDFLDLGLGSIREVAERSGIDKSHLSRIHSGKRGGRISANAIQKLAGALGVSALSLIEIVAKRSGAVSSSHEQVSGSSREQAQAPGAGAAAERPERPDAA